MDIELTKRIGLQADGQFILDHSMREAFHTCELKWWIKYGQWRQTSERNVDLYCGECLHKAVAYYYQGASPEQVMATFDQEYGEWAKINVSVNDTKTADNARAALWVWLCRRAESRVYKPIPRTIEQHFAFPLDEHGEYVYCGRIDALCEGDLGVCLEETKSTGRADEAWVEQWHMADQITGYFVGLAEDPRWNLKLDYVYVNAIEIARLPEEQNRKCRKHGLKYEECWQMHNRTGIYGPYIRPEERLAAWRKAVLHDAMEMKEILTSAGEIDQLELIDSVGMVSPSRGCQRCEWKAYCLSGLTVEKILANSVEHSWNPCIVERGKGVGHEK